MNTLILVASAANPVTADNIPRNPTTEQISSTFLSISSTSVSSSSSSSLADKQSSA